MPLRSDAPFCVPAGVGEAPVYPVTFALTVADYLNGGFRDLCPGQNRLPCA